MSLWEEKRLAVLVTGAEHTIQRARYVFITINIAGIILIIPQFNSACAWIRHSVYRNALKESDHRLEMDQKPQRNGDKDPSKQTETPSETASEPMKDMRSSTTSKRNSPQERQSPPLLSPQEYDAGMSQARRLRKDLMENELSMVSAPLIGSKFHSSDASLLGSAAMLILSIWFFYSVRRENNIVGVIVREAEAALQHPKSESAKEKAAYLYDAIAHFFVFTTHEGQESEDFPAGQGPEIRARLGVRVLMYMPVWVPLGLAGWDMLSLLLPLSWLRILHTDASAWAMLLNFEKIEFLIRMIVVIAVSSANAQYVRRVVQYDTATRRDIIRLKEKLAPSGSSR